MHPGRAFRTLHLAVRPRVIARYLGQILGVVAVLTLVPAGVALFGGRPDVAARYALVIAVFGVVGGAASRISTTERLQANEALAISALAFLLPGLAMAYPLVAYGIAPLDAIFESISGVTTTGLSTLASVEGRPRAFLFARAWLQWVGGLGVVVLALAFTIPSGVAAKHLGFEEREMADYVGGTRSHARRILGVYVALTVAGFGLCLLSGMPWFEALANCLAAVSTGGFGTADSSLAPFDAAQRTAVTVVCIAGAVSFAVYYRGSLRGAWRDTRLRTLLALCAIATVALGIVLLGSTPDRPGDLGWQAFWLAVSAQTTAGFATSPVADLPAGGQLVLIGSMFVGGEVGSTAGGLKILRLLILLQIVIRRLHRVSAPQGSHLPPRIGGSVVRSGEVESTVALAAAYVGILFLSWIPFVVLGHEPLAALFDVTSALGTVGLSAGTVGPDLAPALKTILCLNMLLGRVELFAFIVLISPNTWIGRRRRAQ